ncbi:uncharacterized protein A4U43_C07F9600 [Asparagus officinalis]|uniref:Uncharacterized protein n=1 Tax=Asparagus officinalis TaxID=4686 RepID=A0A5P1EFT0_ASPOF|nr:uncharacterized protein A4U43_C07F9600 [Asparagus officinalis]
MIAELSLDDHVSDEVRGLLRLVEEAFDLRLRRHAPVVLEPPARRISAADSDSMSVSPANDFLVAFSSDLTALGCSCSIEFKRK